MGTSHEFCYKSHAKTQRENEDTTTPVPPVKLKFNYVRRGVLEEKQRKEKMAINNVLSFFGFHSLSNYYHLVFRFLGGFLPGLLVMVRLLGG